MFIYFHKISFKKIFTTKIPPYSALLLSKLSLGCVSSDPVALFSSSFFSFTNFIKFQIKFLEMFVLNFMHSLTLCTQISIAQLGVKLHFEHFYSSTSRYSHKTLRVFRLTKCIPQIIFNNNVN